MAFTATQAELDRYFVKAGLGQASVMANSPADITLTYWRFDSDTGQRIDDEVTPVDYQAIVAERNFVQGQVAERQQRLDTLNVVVDYLNGLLPPPTP